MRTCEVCQLTETDTESVLFPTEVGRLFAMMERWRDDAEGWPSVWVCSACEEATRDTFRALAELPAAVLVLVTCESLAGVCREALRRR